LSKQSPKNPLRRFPILLLEQFHRQDITTECIPHRQWFNSLTIADPKPTFKIHRPDVIAASGAGQFASPQLRTGRHPATLTTVQPHSPEPFANRSGAGNLLTGIFFPESGCQFSASPTAMPPT
jgi:hypothetical protein